MHPDGLPPLRTLRLALRALAVAVILPFLAEARAAEPELKDGVYRAQEAGHPMHGATLIFEKKGEQVVGIFATPYGINCYRGSLGATEIRVTDAVRRQEDYETKRVSFVPVFESDRDRFHPLRFLVPIEPFPNPRAILPTPKVIIDRDMKWLAECQSHFGEAPAPVLDEEPECAPFQTDLLKDPKNAVEANRDWLTILQTLEDFYETQKQHMDPERAETVARAVIAHQFLNLAELSQEGRASNGYWSAELARESLLALTGQVNEDKSSWLEAEGRKGILEWIYCFALDDIVGVAASEEHCAQVEVGSTHLDRHLRPFLREHIRRKLALGLEGCEKERVRRLVTIYSALREEHETFVQNAVVPGFDNVTEMGLVGQTLAKLFLPGKAQEARKSAAVLAVWDLEKSGGLSANEARILVMSITNLEH